MSGRLDESTLLRAPGVAAAMLGNAPAWVWDVEQGRILLSSAAGIAFFDEKDFEALAARRFDMDRPGMNQLARLGRRTGDWVSIPNERGDFAGTGRWCAEQAVGADYREGDAEMGVGLNCTKGEPGGAPRTAGT